MWIAWVIAAFFATPSLAEGPEWRALLHVRDGDSLADSQIRDPAFFLSDEPRTLLEEWHANVEELRSGRLHCRFPARARLLCDAVELDICQDPPPCNELDRFRRRHAARRIYIAFGSYGPDNPATLYGHSFLWLSPSRDGEVSSRGQVVGFETDLSDLTALEFGPRAILGRLPGAYRTEPFDEREHVYRYDERRDLWLFEIALSDAQHRQLVDHIFEVRDLDMRYGLMRDNCALRLLELLAVIFPDEGLNGIGAPFVSPADAVKRLHARELLRGGIARPSTWRSYEWLRSSLSDEQRETLAELVDGIGDPAQADVATLDAGLLHTELFEPYSTFARRTAWKDDGAPDFSSPRRRMLLARMERAEVSREVPNDTDESPLHGHSLSRAQVGAGVNSALGAFTEVDFRVALHDESDAPRGYPYTIHLSTVQARLRWLTESSSLWLDEAVLVRAGARPDILSHAAFISWTVGADAIRLPLDGETTLLHGGAMAEMGATTRSSEHGFDLEAYAFLGARVGVPIDATVAPSAVGTARVGARLAYRRAVSASFEVLGAAANATPAPWGHALRARVVYAPLRDFAVSVLGTERSRDRELSGAIHLYF